MSPMEGSERVYIVARIAMTTKSQEEGLAGYTPVITLFCSCERTKIHLNVILPVHHYTLMTAYTLITVMTKLR